jgi:hypothetical protein
MGRSLSGEGGPKFVISRVGAAPGLPPVKERMDSLALAMMSSAVIFDLGFWFPWILPPAIDTPHFRLRLAFSIGFYQD